MKKWILLGVSILGMLSLTAFTEKEYTNTDLVHVQGDEVTAIINKDTSKKELEDLKKFFAENGIELIIKNVKYNDKDEIIELSLVIQKGNSKSQFSSTANKPISEIELGYKNGNLYVTNSEMFDIMAWKNQSGFNQLHFNLDSLMQKHNFAFDFNFDEENDSIFFGGSANIQKLKDQIMNSFHFEEDEDGNFIFNGQNLGSMKHFGSKKYHFVDNPDIEKLIIIDGKESDFETLDKMAKDDRLDEVDFLKPETAISIYGNKAKDGAIIATTKK